MEREEQAATAAAPELTDADQKEKKPEDQQQQQPLSPNALKLAATDCLNNWITYLQILNNLCSAGLRLSQSLYILSQQQNLHLASQCHLSWEELTRATAFASHSVKSHVTAAVQDLSIGDTFTEGDAHRQREHNQQIVAENLLAFINLQYQFSIAGLECFGGLAACPQCQAAPGTTHDPECGMAVLQQCFAKSYSHEPHSQLSSPHVPTDSPKEVGRQQSPLVPEPRGSSPYHEFPRGPSPVHVFAEVRGPTHVESLRGPFPNPGQLQTMKFPFSGRGSRSPLQFPLFPLSSQRRWSEAAAGEVGSDSGDSSMRRWSMPWDSARVEAAPWKYMPSKLTVPTTTASQERSQSTTPEAISQPATIPTAEGLAEAIQLLSCRPMRCSVPNTSTQGMPGVSGPSGWPDVHEERTHRRIFPGMSSQRGNWQSLDVPQISSMSVTEHYDIFPAGVPLTSRKSSSSTDSSSCLSIHSRSTTSSSEKGSESLSGGDAIRLHTNLYSMWSGSEHLPFIRLPESQEPQDDSDEDASTDKSLFPKPT